jgi:tetratricopeptide (TPR) repeat protein
MRRRCLDERFRDMIHHYELGLLSEEECRDFELHLYECDHCFEEVRRFSETTQLIRHDPDVREVIEQIAAERSASPRRKTWQQVVPVVVIAAAALILLILRPWHVEIQPSRDAVAQENRLAIFEFTDLSGDSTSAWIGRISANLLVTDLSESHFLQIISRQRLLDIQTLLAEETGRAVTMDESTALEIARRADARWLLIGSVIQAKPEIVLSVQLVDVRTGNTTAGRRVVGDARDGVFALIDRLSQEIKSDMSLPLAAHDEVDPQVADLTTESVEAYHYYLAGVELAEKFFNVEAIESFQKALEYDSTLAMAYYYLSGLSGIAGRRHINQAVKYIDHAGSRDKYYIRSRMATYSRNSDSAIAILNEAVRRFPDEKGFHYQLGQLHYTYRNDYAGAARHFNTVLSLDPAYKQAYNFLAYCYDRMGEFENAIEAINKCIALAPDEPNPYDSRGEIYANNGRPERAIESYRTAVRLKPDFYGSVQSLGILYCLTQQYELADEQFKALRESDITRRRAMGIFFLPWTAMAQGKLKQAMKRSDESIAANRAEEEGAFLGYLSSQYFVRAMILTEMGDNDAAAEAMAEHRRIFPQAYPGAVVGQRHFHIQMLAESGAIAEARDSAQSLLDDIERLDPRLVSYYKYSMGCIERADRRLVEATAYFEEAASAIGLFPYHYMLAVCYLEGGRLAEAVDEFESLMSRYTYQRAYWAFRNVKMHYHLGVAYEMSNWTDRAIEQYERVLSIWEDADEGIEEIEDAQARLARLQTDG